MAMSAADWARRMSELRDVKPRTLKQWFGARGPDAEQLARYNAQMKDWQSLYRYATKMHKATLAREQGQSDRWTPAQKRRIRRAASVPGYTERAIGAWVVILVSPNGERSIFQDRFKTETQAEKFAQRMANATGCDMELDRLME